jgi:hypothetical protein
MMYFQPTFEFAVTHSTRYIGVSRNKYGQIEFRTCPMHDSRMAMSEACHAAKLSKGRPDVIEEFGPEDVAPEQDVI